ncbi:hypothetical protein HYPSUDRAFT_846082 [Hypholoma sublateritium FD-334 SS-4]|uniref:Uncharacterized protein n=1 Tax=Hypholoma sublateritium (strain FD-334 SS-4) TaxID=945553 RepID=A0A0D2NM28_HYPSF|nr:hypothetical protein HYPSUDRAFT_846082 [Hypholoma sublateritium FD-334 SS-4]
MLAFVQADRRQAIPLDTPNFDSLEPEYLDYASCNPRWEYYVTLGISDIPMLAEGRDECPMSTASFSAKSAVSPNNSWRHLTISSRKTRVSKLSLLCPEAFLLICFPRSESLAHGVRRPTATIAQDYHATGEKLLVQKQSPFTAVGTGPY